MPCIQQTQHSALSTGHWLLAIAVPVILLAAAPVRSQEFEGYEMPLSEEWEKIEYKEGASAGRVEYIYKDRALTLLKVKRARISPGERAAAIADKELDQTLQFWPGYKRDRVEEFGGGNHKGVLAQFNFTRTGKPMMGRYYYLQGDETTVWVLQFTGDRTFLGQIRNVTDQIARGFKQKQ